MVLSIRVYVKRISIANNLNADRKKTQEEKFAANNCGKDRLPVFEDTDQAAIKPCIAANVSAISSSEGLTKKVRYTSGTGSQTERRSFFEVEAAFCCWYSRFVNVEPLNYIPHDFSIEQSSNRC